jgi:hypothetical protein
MSEPTVPINEASYQLLKELSEQTGQPIAEVLHKALDAYRRKLFFDQMNAGYAELRADPEAWAEHLAERELWDATLMDGLGPEHWTEENHHTRAASLFSVGSDGRGNGGEFFLGEYPVVSSGDRQCWGRLLSGSGAVTHSASRQWVKGTR